MPSFLVFSQHGLEEHSIEGRVFQEDSLNQQQAIPYANVYWLLTMEGVISDSLGRFNIHKPHTEEDLYLVVSFVGFNPDTLLVEEEQTYIAINLEEARSFEEVKITKNRTTNINSRISLMPTQLITEVGIQKLACCNIGESFESNATIDVGFSDAISGAKKIRMLGLDGKYSQFLFENIPFLRGPESGFGLSHIPGPFMESIQVSKGTSSVLNGYESTTGQINVEYKKPADTDLLFVNLFANTEGRYESNISSGIKVNDQWSGMIFLHASTQNKSLDNNSDGFYDRPLQNQINFLNRWEYNPDGFMHLQFGVEVLNESRIGGQLNFKGKDNNPENLYGIDIDISKVRVFSKLGYAFPKNPGQSIGWINSFSYYDQGSMFGFHNYKGNVRNFYSNLIWQTQLQNSKNNLSSGFSFMLDDYSESFLGTNVLRKEIVPGAFTQYTYSIQEKLVFMAGMRADINSVFGFLFTPRLHLKYNLNENYIIRATIGQSHRSPNVYTENLSYLASSREFVINTAINMEEAINKGISFSRHFHLPEQREASLTFDFYRTDFQNQMIVDLDHSVSEINIYNLQDGSYSNSFQADFTGEIFKFFDMTVAYRYNDAKADYLDGIKELPFTNKHKALFTTTYKTRYEKWKVDLTVQYNGSKRLPDTSENPVEFQLENRSPGYYMIHAQITKKFKHFELYTGVENLTSYRQEEAIIDAENPFGEHFDASMVWGPLTGRMFYGGLRFSL